MLNLATMVPRRLQKNAKLRQELAHGIRQIKGKHPDSAGSQETLLTIPIDGSRVVDLFALIAKGLAWFHWGTLLGPDCAVRAGAISKRGEQLIDQFFMMKPSKRVNEKLGEGTFQYEGFQASQPQLTIWRFSIYGGVCLAGDSRAPGVISTQFFAITGLTQDIAQLELEIVR